MWLCDLEIVIQILYKRYGGWCCVERIENNCVYMTNGDKYYIPDLLENGLTFS